MRRNQILQGSWLGQGPFSRENFFCYVLKGSLQGRKFKTSGARSYLEIGQSVCCKIWSAGSHMTGYEYLRTKFDYLQKLGSSEIFKNFNFIKKIHFIFIFCKLKFFCYDLYLDCFSEKMMYYTLS